MQPSQHERFPFPGSPARDTTGDQSFVKSLLIFTDAGNEVGYGHLTRCRSIAAIFTQRGYKTRIAVQATNIQLNSNEELVQWHELGTATCEAIRNADIVLVDSIMASESHVESILTISSNAVIIDDFLHRSYSKGIIVDWTPGAENNPQLNQKPPVRYLVGSQYCALRPPFWTPRERTFPAQPAKILVTLGGSDIRLLTSPVVRHLLTNFPHVQVHAVVGGGMSDTKEYREFALMGVQVHNNLDATGMCDLMDAVDLAISGGGQTLYEIACRGLPSIAINLIDNQTADINNFSSSGFSCTAGKWDDPGLLDRIIDCVNSLWGIPERVRASTIGRSLVDGKGAVRLADEIEWIIYKIRRA